MNGGEGQQVRLAGLTPAFYQHPADRAATAAIERIPQLTYLSRKYLTHLEWLYRAEVMSSGIKLGPAQLPSVYQAHVDAYRRLDMPILPDLYLTESPHFNASVFGANRPIATIQSRTVESLEQRSIRAILGHEAGHVHCGHSAHGQIATFLTSMLSRLSGPASKLPTAALRPLLEQWQRSRELSCDRAAALVMGDVEPVCRMLMYLAAGTTAAGLSLDAFIDQCRLYVDPPSRADKVLHVLTSMKPTHPVPVRRVKLLLDWAEGPDFHAILSGDLPPSQLSHATPEDMYLNAARKDIQEHDLRMDQLAREAERQLDASIGQVEELIVDRLEDGPTELR